MISANASPISKFKAAKTNWYHRLLNWAGLNANTVVKVYRGYGRDGQLQVFGHVLQLSARPREKFSGNILANMFALIRLFMVRPIPGAIVELTWQEQRITATAAADGFFHFQWIPVYPTPAGWHPVTVSCVHNNQLIAHDTGELYIPHRTQFGCISDIDDTFLISHSAHLLKRLHVLFTRNARSRQPFEGVVQHYQLLSQGGTTPNSPNPFFYVSSSEWNLYEYILEFANTWQLPQGVYLLNQIKKLSQLLKTGQGKHGTKFTRITRILESYPDMRFVLLGDDTQQDPYIYQAIAKHFPERVLGIYLRHLHKKNKMAVQQVVDAISAQGIHCCYFKHSEEAIAHSRKTGLIS